MRILRSFSVKTSLLFLALLLIMGAAQALLTLRISDTRRAEIDQLVNWDLAQKMSGEIVPVLKNSGDLDGLEPAIHYMMVLNPNIEVYVVDTDGTILAWFMDGGGLERKEIGTGPLEEFIEMRQKAPILGDDPRSRTGRKPFSVAEIDLNSGRQGYLYIILRSSIWDRAAEMGSEKVLTRALGSAFLLSLLSVGILGLALFSSLTRRIGSLTKGVRAFEAGDLDRRIELAGRDEVGELTSVFNTMAETLQSTIKRLEETDRLHRELAANISHDLRSPLTTIRGYLETLSMKLEELPVEGVRHYLGIIQGESDKLKRLIDDLFQLSLLESEQLQLDRELFSLTELLQDELLLYRARAAERNIRIETGLPHRLLPVEGDLKLIRRALTNLLDNAFAYTPDGGDITVAVTEEPGQIMVEVIDSGPGISDRELPYIFQRFYRGSSVVSDREGGGSGLGLSIALRIIELHGGSLGVSRPAKGGSRFFFRLPAGGDAKLD